LPEYVRSVQMFTGFGKYLRRICIARNITHTLPIDAVTFTPAVDGLLVVSVVMETMSGDINSLRINLIYITKLPSSLII